MPLRQKPAEGILNNGSHLPFLFQIRYINDKHHCTAEVMSVLPVKGLDEGADKCLKEVVLS